MDAIGLSMAPSGSNTGAQALHDTDNNLRYEEEKSKEKEKAVYRSVLKYRKNSNRREICYDIVAAAPSKAPSIFLLFCLSSKAEFVVFSLA